MGYTHYWEQPKTIPQETWNNKVMPAVDMLIQEFMAEGLKLGDGFGAYTEDKLVTENTICFNGSEECNEAYETFRVERETDSRSPEGFNCCKTQYRPYDKLVVAVLMTVTAIVDDKSVFNWYSDGSVAEGNFDAACRLICKTLGEDFNALATVIATQKT